jgi:aspartyl-tRNA(Asn)/glutamyl-tRNA(Gln) amidotransferase subunit B
MRCEPNVSVRPVGTRELGTKVEVKNLNSFRAVKQALDHEIERQARVLEAGGAVRQVTMGWDERRGRTVEQRSKEESDDYRYFPEPDLPPLRISSEWVDQIRGRLPELPDAKRARFVSEYGLSSADAAVLATDREVAAYFEAAVAAGREGDVAPRAVANWLTGELFRLIRSEDVEISQVLVGPEALAELVSLVEGGIITANTGRAVLGETFASGRSPQEIVAEKGLAQVSDQDALAAVVDGVIAANPDQVTVYRGGKETLLQWFLGQVMRETRGKANPQVAKALLEERLNA